MHSPESNIPSSSGNYTAEETARFQVLFWPVAHKYRRCNRMAMWLLGLGFVILLGGILCRNGLQFVYGRDVVPKIVMSVVTWGAFAGVIIGSGFLASRPSLICPACRGSLDQRIVNYCAECGSDRLGTDWLKQPQCRSCGASLKHVLTRRGRKRAYRVRACTHCGLMLDHFGL